MAARLTTNSYGKSAVRLTKVVRTTTNGPRHELFEISADINLEGDFVACYEKGDNRNVVATDTIKNTLYVVAKEKTFATVEQFAIILAEHFIATYPQVSKSNVELYQSSWRRIVIDGAPHDYAFTSDGSHQRYVRVTWSRGAKPTIVGGVRGMLVLKTTASEWRDFHTDRYRTLKDTSDRILATRIDADWTFNASAKDFDAHYESVTSSILRTFATQHSLGVQQTLQQMGEAALDACAAIDSISFELPNQHRIPFNLEPFGLKFEHDIFVATDEPYGLIKGTISREGK